jgi:acetyl esterase
MRAAIERTASRATLSLPGPLLLRVLGERPRVLEGQTLDPRVQFGLALEARRGRKPPQERSVGDARRFIAESFAVLDVDPSPLDSMRDELAEVEGRASVPVRVFRPRDCRGGMLVFFHGGGGVVGSIDAYAAICSYLAHHARMVVVSVGYRLAPEHPYPAGIEDALTGYLWARREAARLGADPGRVAVGGDSMGGNFAAGVCLRCKQQALPLPSYQWLIYPGTDLTRQSPSHETFGTGFVLERPLMDWFVERYLGGHDPGDPGASPLHAVDLGGLPPALVVTAGFDPLRDEGRAYADRLRAAGSVARYRCHRDLVHGFIQMGGAVPAARRAIDAAAETLAAAV